MKKFYAHKWMLTPTPTFNCNSPPASLDYWGYSIIYSVPLIPYKVDPQLSLPHRLVISFRRLGTKGWHLPRGRCPPLVPRRLFWSLPSACFLSPHRRIHQNGTTDDHHYSISITIFELNLKPLKLAQCLSRPEVRLPIWVSALERTDL